MAAGPGASGENVNQQVKDALNITGKTEEAAAKHLATKHYVKIFHLDDPGNEIGKRIIEIGVGHKAFDVFAPAYKFGNLHVRLFSESIEYHFDQVALNGSIGNFVRHVYFDMIRNTYYAIKDLGLIEGLREGL